MREREREGGRQREREAERERERLFTYHFTLIDPCKTERFEQKET